MKELSLYPIANIVDAHEEYRSNVGATELNITPSASDSEVTKALREWHKERHEHMAEDFKERYGKDPSAFEDAAPYIILATIGYNPDYNGFVFTEKERDLPEIVLEDFKSIAEEIERKMLMDEELAYLSFRSYYWG